MRTRRAGLILVALLVTTVSVYGLSTLRQKLAVEVSHTPIAVPSRDREPTGFRAFPWGTPASVLNEKFMGPECGHKSEILSTESKISCSGFDLGEIGSGWVEFEFDPAGGLAGYRITLYGDYPAFRRLAVEKFGPPTEAGRLSYTSPSGRAVSPESVHWDWPGVNASLFEYCPGANAQCLYVETRTLHEKKMQRYREDDERKREKAKKGF